MGGSTRTPTLVALLLLGLCRGPRDQVQAGTLPKPAIWADPGPVVPVGSPVTIWCQGSQQAQVYHLYKEGGSRVMGTEEPHSSSDRVSFYIESIGQYWAGRYQCAYGNSKGRSEWSDLLALVVTGVLPPPSLSAQPSPVVASGENVTLACSSQGTLGTFHLLKEGDSDPPRHREPQYLQGQFQALFPVGPMGPSHGGIYQCYTSFTYSPYQWSEPSAPLRLQLAGSQDPNWSLSVLMGVSGALVLLLLLLLFLFLWHQYQGAHRKWGTADPAPWERGLKISSCPAAVTQEETLNVAQTDSQPEEGAQPDPQQNTQEEGASLSQENCSAGKEQAALPPSLLPGELLDTEDSQAEELKWMDSQVGPSLSRSPGIPPPTQQTPSSHSLPQAAASEEVTYAQLNLLALKRRTAPSSSPSQEPPDEPSMYAVLTIC